MDEQRLDPDQLLTRIKGEKPKESRGRLKIFFGYAAGVGKTYAMLEAAHAAKDAGVDVVAGYIEPHTRPATLGLLDGLERLPPLTLSYKGVALREFDLDGAIARRPQLILVDELAHTNAEGCRHRKRYQDIEELLKAGVDVYTTVNVQHIESLNDIVASITGVIVRERVPDSVFDSADQVKLVDIEPDDLIERLSEGKIYASDQAHRALGHFFTRENLVALREIALRRTADRVNRIAERGKPLGADYYTEEHILICLSSSPSNAKVIRTAARMAGAFHGSFTALFVETPGTAELDGENRGRLRENLRLAEQLGAHIATVYGEDIPAQIAEYAKVSGVSKIVIGRSNNRKGLFARRQNLVERLTVLAPNIDIHIIPDNAPPYTAARRWRKLSAGLSGADTLKTAGILAAASLISMLFSRWNFREANIITVYILGVLFVAMCTRSRIYGAAASLLSVLAFNYLFTAPYLTFRFNDPGYYVTFGVMFTASFLTSTLTMRVRSQARQAAMKAYRTEVLLETSQKLLRAETEREAFEQMAGQLIRLLNKTVLLYPLDAAGPGEPGVWTAPGAQGDTARYTAADERAVAHWVYRNNKHAGATTDTLPGSKCLYLAVRNHDTVFAVVGIAMDDGAPLDVFDRNILIAMLGEFALALEKMREAEQKKRISMQVEQEQLRANLLRAISHDLRTPLTSISGNAGILMGSAEKLGEEKKHQLYTDIYDDAMWLINLVENLLSVTRIENGTMNIRMEPELLDEVIGEALLHLSRRSCEHTIATVQEDDLLMARMDSRLIIQVIINIVNNAVKYTPAGSRITISARREGEMVRVEIADDGGGIPDEAKEKLFQMFYTAQHKRGGDSRRGLGLGLSLCKSIITAHGGTITVRDNLPHGTVFSFTLQAEEVNCHE
ncbi:sensor histidine kinase KdpD [Anaerotruncus massiliensis (ex Togo et al. 2019)]|uniref:sensor histidine kinase n=1 Tax=Anaerotruncus massiliensis (ex Togo et al. 2019) TaxID=1673720 RepID=UPI0027BA8A69|nr:sensor histidine kinase KdpD [Anaerotruncus massiliensis (ex Togo et al. 2019)]